MQRGRKSLSVKPAKPAKPAKKRVSQGNTDNQPRPFKKQRKTYKQKTKNVEEQDDASEAVQLNHLWSDDSVSTQQGVGFLGADRKITICQNAALPRLRKVPDMIEMLPDAPKYSWSHWDREERKKDKVEKWTAQYAIAKYPWLSHWANYGDSDSLNENGVEGKGREAIWLYEPDTVAHKAARQGWANNFVVRWDRWTWARDWQTMWAHVSLATEANVHVLCVAAEIKHPILCEACPSLDTASTDAAVAKVAQRLSASQCLAATCVRIGKSSESTSWKWRAFAPRRLIDTKQDKQSHAEQGLQEKTDNDLHGRELWCEEPAAIWVRDDAKSDQWRVERDRLCILCCMAGLPIPSSRQRILRDATRAEVK